jgi:hypothetical protein
VLGYQRRPPWGGRNAVAVESGRDRGPGAAGVALAADTRANLVGEHTGTAETDALGLFLAMPSFVHCEIKRRSSWAKVASTWAMASPPGVEVSTQSSATSDQPCFRATRPPAATGTELADLAGNSSFPARPYEPPRTSNPARRDQQAPVLGSVSPAAKWRAACAWLRLRAKKRSPLIGAGPTPSCPTSRCRLNNQSNRLSELGRREERSAGPVARVRVARDTGVGRPLPMAPASPGASTARRSRGRAALASSTSEAARSAGGRVLSQPPTVNDCVRSAVELSPAYTSMLPGSTTNLPLLS